MRKYLLLFVLFASISCSAQDTLFFHNRKSVDGKVVEVTEQYVKFVYKGETALNVVSRNSLAEIHFSSGRVQQMSPKIEINNPEKDWEKVRVVYDKDEVMGLKSLGQIEKHSSGTWSFYTTGGHFSEKTLKKIRKEAAKMGGCMVLILSAKSKSGGFFNDGHASMAGEVYTY